VEFAVGDVNESRYIAAQIQQCMKLDCAFALPKAGPGEHGQTKVDDGGIQCIYCLIQIENSLLVQIQFASDTDQMVSEVGVHTPISVFVCLGKGASGYLAPYPHMIKLPALGSKTGLDIPKTLAVGQLSECHDAKLIEARKAFYAEIALILRYASLEVFQRHKVHDLSENEWACVHRNPLPGQ